MKKTIFRSYDKQVIRLLIPLRGTAPHSGLSEYTKQQSAAPGNLLALYGEALKSYSQGIASYDKCLAMRGESIKIYRQSIYSSDEALDRAPNYVGAHNNKGVAMPRLRILHAALSKHKEALESYSKAIAAFSKALEIAPFQTTIHAQLVELQRKLRRSCA